MRNFSTTSSDAACAPAVSFAADLVHACAIRGGNVDTGLPLSAPPGLADAAGEAVAPLQPTNIVVALIGSPVYFPALVRAMQVCRGSGVTSWDEGERPCCPMPTTSSSRPSPPLAPCLAARPHCGRGQQPRGLGAPPPGAWLWPWRQDEDGAAAAAAVACTCPSPLAPPPPPPPRRPCFPSSAGRRPPCCSTRCCRPCSCPSRRWAAPPRPPHSPLQQ